MNELEQKKKDNRNNLLTIFSLTGLYLLRNFGLTLPGIIGSTVTAYATIGAVGIIGIKTISSVVNYFSSKIKLQKLKKEERKKELESKKIEKELERELKKEKILTKQLEKETIDKNSKIQKEVEQPTINNDSEVTKNSDEAIEKYLDTLSEEELLKLKKDITKKVQEEEEVIGTKKIS